MGVVKAREYGRRWEEAREGGRRREKMGGGWEEGGRRVGGWWGEGGYLGVPVGVVKDDGVGGLEVDSEPTSAGGEQEAEL